LPLDMSPNSPSLQPSCSPPPGGHQRHLPTSITASHLSLMSFMLLMSLMPTSYPFCHLPSPGGHQRHPPAAQDGQQPHCARRWGHHLPQAGGGEGGGRRGREQVGTRGGVCVCGRGTGGGATICHRPEEVRAGACGGWQAVAASQQTGTQGGCVCMWTWGMSCIFL
jgi:hypothetical protein